MVNKKLVIISIIIAIIMTVSTILYRQEYLLDTKEIKKRYNYLLKRDRTKLSKTVNFIKIKNTLNSILRTLNNLEKEDNINFDIKLMSKNIKYLMANLNEYNKIISSKNLSTEQRIGYKNNLNTILLNIQQIALKKSLTSDSNVFIQVVAPQTTSPQTTKPQTTNSQTTSPQTTQHLEIQKIRAIEPILELNQLINYFDTST